MSQQAMNCENCGTEMKPEKKKLGFCVNWFVCPDCGNRVRPESGMFKKSDALTDRRITGNKTGFKKPPMQE